MVNEAFRVVGFYHSTPTPDRRGRAFWLGAHALSHTHTHRCSDTQWRQVVSSHCSPASDRWRLPQKKGSPLSMDPSANKRQITGLAPYLTHSFIALVTICKPCDEATLFGHMLYLPLLLCLIGRPFSGIWGLDDVAELSDNLIKDACSYIRLWSNTVHIKSIF